MSMHWSLFASQCDSVLFIFDYVTITGRSTTLLAITILSGQVTQKTTKALSKRERET
jgi:hypothetical protein